MITIKPMLAVPGALPTGPGWAYEFKFDGYRAIYFEGTYYGRSGRPLPGPRLPPLELPIDGELVALDEHGKPSFEAMQRGGATGFIAFDLVVPELRYTERRELLEDLPGLQISPRFDDGPATVAAARELGLEGVMAKRLDSFYRPGVRSPDWIKWKFVQTGDFIIGGWRSGARALGSLLIGVPAGGGRTSSPHVSADGLLYRGRVGGGITATTEAAVLPVLRDLASSQCPFVDYPAQGEPGPVHWVEPLLVVEVRYREITQDGRLRFPVFVRMRPDKAR